MSRIKTEIYLHTDKSDMANFADDLGIGGAARDKFRYTGYEVVISIEVDLDTGDAIATHLNGATLRETVKV